LPLDFSLSQTDIIQEFVKINSFNSLAFKINIDSGKLVEKLVIINKLSLSITGAISNIFSLLTQVY